MPNRAANIQVARLNAIPFERGWIHGLRALLAKLEEDGVPKNPAFSPAAVSSWWRAGFSPNRGVSHEPDEYVSNWFPLRSVPSELQFHELRRKSMGLVEAPRDLPYPAFQHAMYLVSFASADDFSPVLSDEIRIADSYSLPAFDAPRLRTITRAVDGRQMRDFVTRLLRIAWDRMIVQRGLPVHHMANGVRCFYFRRGQVPDDTISFVGVQGRPATRSVVGFKTVRARPTDSGTKRIWHFGIHTDAVLRPVIALAVRPHVLFSDDGRTTWESASRLHKARRNQCKHWWNAEWRDRILATTTWLGGEQGEIELTLSGNLSAFVSTSPLRFASPVSYAEPEPPTRDETTEELADVDENDEGLDELGEPDEISDVGEDDEA